MQQELKPKITYCRPHNLGWLRRPELDVGFGAVWEKPDGELVFADKRKGDILIALVEEVEVTDAGKNASD